MEFRPGADAGYPLGPALRVASKSALTQHESAAALKKPGVCATERLNLERETLIPNPWLIDAALDQGYYLLANQG